MSAVSILLAAAAVFLSMSRPAGGPPPGPPLPQIVTVTLLAPTAPAPSTTPAPSTNSGSRR